jgi:hypothetical protein
MSSRGAVSTATVAAPATSCRQVSDPVAELHTAAQSLHDLADAAACGRAPTPALAGDDLRALRHALDRAEAAWSRHLAAFDATGGGLIDGAPSTAAWLRVRCRMAPATAKRHVATARACHGPSAYLPGTGAAVGEGEISPAHAEVLARDLRHLGERERDSPRPAPAPDSTADPDGADGADGADGSTDDDGLLPGLEPILLELASRVDPMELHRFTTRILAELDPRVTRDLDAARGDVWFAVSPTFGGAFDLRGLVDAELGNALLAALMPLAAPESRTDPLTGEPVRDLRPASQRMAEALRELVTRYLALGDAPTTGGERPQATITIDLATLTADVGLAELGWGGSITPEAARRFTCDADLTRAIILTNPARALSILTGAAERRASLRSSNDPSSGKGRPPALRLGPFDPTAFDLDRYDPTLVDLGGSEHARGDPGPEPPPWNPPVPDPALFDDLALDPATLTRILRALPPALGGPPSTVLDLGRTQRLYTASLRKAVIARDRACVFPGCGRHWSWCEVHHLIHWARGGTTDLANAALLCLRHHHAVHEGGWLLWRDPDGIWRVDPPPALFPA